MSMVKTICGIGLAAIAAFGVKRVMDIKCEESYIQGYMEGQKEGKIEKQKNDATDKLFDLINQMKREKEKIVVKRTTNEEKLKYMALVEKYGMDEAVKIVWKNINNNKG